MKDKNENINILLQTILLPASFSICCLKTTKRNIWEKHSNLFGNNKKSLKFFCLILKIGNLNFIPRWIEIIFAFF